MRHNVRDPAQKQADRVTSEIDSITMSTMLRKSKKCLTLEPIQGFILKR